MPESVNADDALEFIVKELDLVPVAWSLDARPNGYDIQISNAARTYWWRRKQIRLDGRAVAETE